MAKGHDVVNKGIDFQVYSYSEACVCRSTKHPLPSFERTRQLSYIRTSVDDEDQTHFR